MPDSVDPIREAAIRYARHRLAAIALEIEQRQAPKSERGRISDEVGLARSFTNAALEHLFELCRSALERESERGSGT
jgi:hypothetical protein